MRIIITGGPTISPLDRVRYIGNHSTGKLSTTLAQFAQKSGHEVLFLRSKFCTHPAPHGLEIIEFDTHQSLLEALQKNATHLPCDTLWHAAAVGDFVLEKSCGPTSTPDKLGKWDSRGGNIQITLRPAPKILPLLPQIFPSTKIVGWKFEVDGDRSTIVKKGLSQIRECQTSACVLNGPAWGKGWGLLLTDNTLQSSETYEELYRSLMQVASH